MTSSRTARASFAVELLRSTAVGALLVAIAFPVVWLSRTLTSSLTGAGRH